MSLMHGANMKILKPSLSSYLSAYEDGTVCSETSAYKIQTPGNYPEETTQHSEHGESLKSRMVLSNFELGVQPVKPYSTVTNYPWMSLY